MDDLEKSMLTGDYFHEACDRAFILSNMFDQLLSEHAAVKAMPELRKQASVISDALGDFYQACGLAMADFDDKPESRSHISMSLENEFKFYLEHQKELVAMHPGKVIAIKGGKVLGAYESEPEAIKALSKSHKLGTYLLQRCLPGKDAHTRTFRSRV